MAITAKIDKLTKTTKMANTLKELNRSAEENCKKGRISFKVGKFEDALAAYGEAADAWKEIREGGIGSSAG